MKELSKVLGVEVPTVAATIPEADAMNATERRYSGQLELRRLSGEVWRFDFQAIKLRLADETWYTPDFAVYLADGTLEFHEVKGFWREDARVKFKVAADQFPFPFVAVKLKQGRWEVERLEPKRRAD